MLLTALLLFAAQRHGAIVPHPDDPAPPPASARNRPCDTRGTDITVCAPMSRERMEELRARFAEKPIRAVIPLPGGGSVSLAGEQRGLPGASAPAAMLSLRIPLGREAKPAPSETDDE